MKICFSYTSSKAPKVHQNVLCLQSNPLPLAKSESQVVYVEKQRVFVKDTDNGKQIAEEINDLMNLLKVYNS